MPAAARSRAMVVAVVAVILGHSGCGDGGTDEPECRTHTQCPGGRCTGGRCVPQDSGVAGSDARSPDAGDGDAAVPPSGEIHVAPTGSDADPGTPDRPLRTLVAAQQAVRRLRSDWPEGTFPRIEVILGAGTYALEAPLVFGPEDGGSPTCPVIYRARDGEVTTISGGSPLLGWAPTANPAILRAPAAGQRFRQLYLTSGWLGDRPIRARFPYPDRQYLKVLEVIRVPAGCAVSAFRLETPYPLEPAQVDELVGSEMVILKTFAQSRLFVQAASLTGEREVTVYPTAATGIAEGCASDTLIDGAFRVYFEGRPAWIVDAGRWAFDADGSVQYLPHAYDVPEGGMVAPRLENLITVAGSEAEPVGNLTFDGLELRHTGWLAPSDVGEIGKQAGFDSFAWVGAVRIEHARDVRVTRSRLAQLGASGVVIGPDTERIAIDQNSFSEISGNGISVQTLGVTDLADDRQLCRGLRVEDNLLQGIGLDYAGVGIFAGYLPGAVIRGNQFRFISYSAISLGWFPLVSVPGIGLDGGIDRVPTGSVVERNDISLVTRYYHDGGGIYVIGGNPGLAIRENYLHDLVYSTDEGGFVGFLHAGIYLDGYASDNLVTDNYEHNLTDGLFLQTYLTATVDARAKFNTITALSMTSVDTPIYLMDQVLAEAVRPEVANVIEWDEVVRDDLVMSAGLSAEARALWAQDLGLAYAGFFRVDQGIYFSRGPEYCVFPTWEAYVAASGNLDVRQVPVYPALPTGQVLVGGCP